MRSALLVAVTLALAPPDSSWRGREVDLTKIELVRSLGPWKPSTLSPAGNSFALYTGNAVRLVDVASEREALASERKPRQLTGHLANIHDSGWSRDGRFFATSGYDGTVRVWETSTGKALASVSAHAGYACSVALSSDGRYLATGGSDDNLVKIFEVEGGREIRSITTTGGATYSMGFTGDGKYVVGSQGDECIRAWSVADGAEVKGFTRSIGYVHTYAFTRDGRMLAYPASDGAIALVETETWKQPLPAGKSAPEPRKLEGHPGGTSFVAFHPSGRHLASTGVDGSLRIWDVASGKVVREFAGLGQGSRVAFGADGQSVVVAGGDEMIRVFGRKP
jgi:WD40 repeat protein